MRCTMPRPRALRQSSLEHAITRRPKRSSTTVGLTRPTLSIHELKSFFLQRMDVVVLIPGWKSGRTHTHTTSEHAATPAPIPTMLMTSSLPTTSFPLSRMSPQTHSPIPSSLSLAPKHASQSQSPAPRLGGVMAQSRALLDAASDPIHPHPRLPMMSLKCLPSQQVKHPVCVELVIYLSCH